MATPTFPPTSGPDCWKCRHFAVSWDPKLPYLCKLMGFKSKSLPCIEVLRADGKTCQGFVAKGAAPVLSSPQASLSGFRR